MKRVILFLSMFLLLLTPVFGQAEETGDMESAVVTVETVAVEEQVIVLEDGTEEVHIVRTRVEGVDRFADERIVAIEDEAREKIKAVLEEIDGLGDRSGEGALQKEIERIKLDAEIARLRVIQKDAEDAGEPDLADEMRDEIEHLETLDEPVIGVSQEQPVPEPRAAEGKEGK